MLFRSWNFFTLFSVASSKVPVTAGLPKDCLLYTSIWEGGHGTTSQHYAGVAFDVGQSSTAAKRRKIYNAAVRTGAWGYVEPLSMTPTWVHFDRRYGKMCIRDRGMPGPYGVVEG